MGRLGSCVWLVFLCLFYAVRWYGVLFVIFGVYLSLMKYAATKKINNLFGLHHVFIGTSWV